MLSREFKDGERRCGGIHPAEGGGGDDTLGIGRQRVHQGVATCGIKFSEDIVDQVDGRHARFFLQKGGLRHFQGDGDGALLSLGGKFRGTHAVESDENVIPVWACLGLSGTEVGAKGGGEFFCKIPANRRSIGDLNLFRCPGDSVAGLDDVRAQEVDELRPECAEPGSMVDESGGINLPLGRIGRAVLEEVIPRFQYAVVPEELFPVGRVPLRANSIKVFASGIRTGSHEFHVPVAEPDDGEAVFQVTALVGTAAPVYLQIVLAAAPDDTACLRTDGAAYAQAFRSLAHHDGWTPRAG